MSESSTTFERAAWNDESVVRSNIGRAKALFFLAAGLSLAAAVALFFSGEREQGIFVGLWVPSILSAGNLLMEGPRS